jgi:zona occludens toxin
MITFITGLPGNGKTLYALNFIKAYAEKEKREVYYSGIKDLLLPWTEIKAEEWPTLPAGSIIVIDEAQFVFPKKPNGSKLPEYYEKLAVHRHSGYDIFIITQHPSLVDNFVRQLAGRHLHLIRKFGMQRANVWEWAAVNTSPEKAVSHKTAILHKFAYPKEVYGYYKSAEVHTHKRAIPAKLVLAVLFVVGVLGAGYYALDRYQQRSKPQAAPSSDIPAHGGVPAGRKSAGGLPVLDPVADLKQYVYASTERVQGLPHTAPKYDEITKPMAAPTPVACIASKSKCLCYTQQGTRMDVRDQTCRDIAEFGYFQEFDPNGRGVDREQTNRSAAVLDRGGQPMPLSGASTVDRSAVSLGDGDGYGVLGKRGEGIRQPGGVSNKL